MPNTPGAAKRMRQSEKRRSRNRAVIKNIKTELKKLEAAAVAGDLDKLRAEVRAVAQKLDKAAQRGVVHPNMAARKKSQVARLLRAKEMAAKK